MQEPIVVYASGTMVRDKCKVLLEQKLIVSADLFESFPFFLKKDGKAKLGFNSNAAILLVERKHLDKVMAALQSSELSSDPIRAYAMPVLATTAALM